MPYRNARTGEMVESTWDKHPQIDGRARIWKREGTPTAQDIHIGSATPEGQWNYPWFYWLPALGLSHGNGSIARTFEAALYQVRMAYMDHWLRTQGFEDPHV